MTQSIINESTEALQADLALAYLIKKPEQVSNNVKAIMLLHGVGSNEQDLFALASQLPKDVFVIAPRGPFAVGVNRYAWYNVDFSSGRPDINAEQETASRQLIRKFIQEVKEKYSIDELYLGGFSHGAIMSQSIGLIHPDEVQGIISLSGRVLQEIRPLVQHDKYLHQLKVFLAHGVQDQTLPIHFAREAKEYLESLGVQLTYHEYPIGHQVSSEVLKDLNAWMK